MTGQKTNEGEKGKRGVGKSGRKRNGEWRRGEKDRREMRRGEKRKVGGKSLEKGRGRRGEKDGIGEEDKGVERRRGERGGQ